MVQIAFPSGAQSRIELCNDDDEAADDHGSTLRPQSDLAKGRIAQDLREAVWPLISAGKIKPVMDQTFGLCRCGWRTPRGWKALRTSGKSFWRLQAGRNPAASTSAQA